uniref:Uncharacterized protein n=1 Tax=Physcomitrium patens TaxID=3218 RepID=A0A2K1JWA2_PHYPA|nr:hypothetical protein PHYPA_015583 [Physcomitrium patens]
MRSRNQETELPAGNAAKFSGIHFHEHREIIVVFSLVDIVEHGRLPLRKFGCPIVGCCFGKLRPRCIDVAQIGIQKQFCFLRRQKMIQSCGGIHQHLLRLA